MTDTRSLKRFNKLPTYRPLVKMINKRNNQELLTKPLFIVDYSIRTHRKLKILISGHKQLSNNDNDRNPNFSK